MLIFRAWKVIHAVVCCVDLLIIRDCNFCYGKGVKKDFGGFRVWQVFSVTDQKRTTKSCFICFEHGLCRDFTGQERVFTREGVYLIVNKVCEDVR